MCLLRLKQAGRKGFVLFFKSGTLFKYQSRKDEGFDDSGRLDSRVRKIWFEDSASLKLKSGDAALT